MRPATLDHDATGPRDERPIRVVIAEDAYLVREAVELILEGAPQIEVARSCEDGTALLAAVITDIRMPPSSNDEGILIAHALRETHPEIGVVVLSQYADADYPLALLEGGSAGRAYLLKESIHDSRQ